MSKMVSEKVKVGILGATGSVGQKFVELLIDHPWFEIGALAASERSAGKKYGDAMQWIMGRPLPQKLQNLEVQNCKPDMDCQIVFSALDAAVAGEIEQEFAKAGHIVVSNARNHRYEPDVPLLIPEVNPDHIDVLEKQNFGNGKIVTNPNCSTTGLVLALKPLYDAFGLSAVNVVTMQALSGAGYPGVPSMDVIDNVVPFIGGEEEKMEKEPLKILGQLTGGSFIDAKFKISASCNRVPVLDGHLEAVAVKFDKVCTHKEIIDALKNFRSKPQELNLPSAPKQPIHYLHEANQPQPRMYRNLENGMAVSVGRLRDCPILDVKFMVLSHNTIRGAAGGALLNAELLVAKGLFEPA